MVDKYKKSLIPQKDTKYDMEPPIDISFLQSVISNLKFYSNCKDIIKI